MQESLWQHVKTGTRYVVKDIALMEVNLKVMITYRAYDKPGPLWIRPLDEFLDGRFKRID